MSAGANRVGVGYLAGSSRNRTPEALPVVRGAAAGFVRRFVVAPAVLKGAVVAVGCGVGGTMGVTLDASVAEGVAVGRCTRTRVAVGTAAAAVGAI